MVPIQRSAKVLATGVRTGCFEDLEAFGSEDLVEGVDERRCCIVRSSGTSAFGIG
jgi:hypothetical protein